MTNEVQIFWLTYLFIISSTCFGRCLRPSSGAFYCNNESTWGNGIIVPFILNHGTEYRWASRSGFITFAERAAGTYLIGG